MLPLIQIEWTRKDPSHLWTGFVKTTLGAGEELVHAQDIEIIANQNYVFGAMLKGGGYDGLKLNVFLFDSGDSFLEAWTIDLDYALGTDWGWATRGFKSHTSTAYAVYSLKNEGVGEAPDTWLAAPFFTPV